MIFVKIYLKTFALDKNNAHFRTKRQCSSDLPLLHVKKEATNLDFSKNYSIKLSSDKNNAVEKTNKGITSALALSRGKRKPQTSYFETLSTKICICQKLCSICFAMFV